jgi:hypothetical protein
MMWKAGHHGDVRDELRIDLRQAIIALLQQAGRPLRAHEIRQRLVALRGVNEHFQIVVADPLIRVGTGLWGLNDRDVSVKRPDQRGLLDGLVDILHRRRFAIHASELVSAGMSATLLSASVVFSLVAADARMRVNQAQYLYLADWGDPRRESVSEAVEAVISSVSSPLRFDEIVACVEARDGEVVAFAGGRQRIAAATRDVPGLRLLDDNFYGVPQAIAVPTDREDRLALVDTALDAFRASGFLAAAVARSGIDGLAVAPAR